MGKTITDFEGDGFKVRKKPKTATGRPIKQKPQVIEKIVEKPVERVVHQPVAENAGVLGEVAKTNAVMHQAIAQMTDSLKNIGDKPKKLACENIERDTYGRMTRFEIVVIE